MPDDSDKPDSPQLPPKLNLRKQGVLKTEAQDSADTPAPPPAAPPPAPEDTGTEAPKLAIKPSPSKETKPGTSRLVVQPADATSSAPTPATTPAQSESPAPAATDQGTATPKGESKRKTSRIPLETAQTPGAQDEAAASASSEPKTLKIKPNAPVPQVRSTQPLNITVPIGSEDSGAAKHKTSRIPLESALTADTEPESASQPADAPADPARPKTIKIKRPGSESATVKKKAAPAKTDEGAMSKTARLDHLPLDEEETAPTQKKTIRVKRPDATSSAAPRPGVDLTPPEPIEAPPSDEPGAAWAILALAATLVLCVVIYLLAAQALGPNISGTALSSWPGGPNLSWPGKIVN